MTFSDLNFDKAHKVDNETEAGPPMHGKIPDIIKPILILENSKLL